MSGNNLTTKTLRGKYQISRNIYVTCYLHVLEATDTSIRMFAGLKSRGDTLIPVGTRIFFNAETLNRVNELRHQNYDIYSLTVQEVKEMNGKPLHVCSSIHKDSRSDLRGQERKSVSFPLMLAGSEFMVKNATPQGALLHYASQKAMMGLILNQQYDFTVSYKENTYTFPAEIKHVQYDWRSHQHILGVAFKELSEDQELILNLLIDPAYTIPISSKQTVDTTHGKISQDD